MAISKEKLDELVKKAFEERLKCGQLFVLPKNASIYTVKQAADRAARREGDIVICYDRNFAKKLAIKASVETVWVDDEKSTEESASKKPNKNKKRS